MKYNIIKNTWMCTALLLAGAVSTATAREGFAILSPRTMAMGGAGVAVQGVDNAVFFNPALLATATRTKVRILDVRAQVNQHSFDQYDFYRNHSSEFENLEAMDVSERNAFYEEMLGIANGPSQVGVGAMGPFTLVKPGFSVGLYHNARLDYDLSEGASAIPVVSGNGVAETEFVLGYARTLGSFLGRSVHLGGNGKFLYRAISAESLTAPAIEVIDDLRVFQGSTIAFDLGLLVDLGAWSAGLAVYDINYPTIDWKVNKALSDGFSAPGRVVDGSMRLGAGYRPLWGVRGLFEDMTFAFDLESPFSSDMSFFKKVNLGGEALFANVIRLRGGVHQGYPTVGAMAAFKVVKLEYAFGGEALGRFPGQLDSWSHVFAFGLGWGY